MFTLLVFNDGRNDYLEQTLCTFFDQVHFPETPHKILIDDMPVGRDTSFLQRIGSRFGFDDLILNKVNLGSFGCIMKAWSCLPSNTKYVFHLENDFVFPEPIDVTTLATVLEEPWICNITLLRQPWYEDERAAGGLLPSKPGRFHERVVRGIPVCLHQDYFGHNPGLYRREFARIIPDSSRAIPGRILSHERIYRDLLIAEDPSRHFAILGGLLDRPRVFHIGYRRTGVSPQYEASQGDLSAGFTDESIECRGLDAEERALKRAAATCQHYVDTFLEPALAARETDRERARQLVADAQAALLSAREEAAALRASKSWQLTAPIRRAYDVLLQLGQRWP